MALSQHQDDACRIRRHAAALPGMATRAAYALAEGVMTGTWPQRLLPVVWLATLAISLLSRPW